MLPITLDPKTVGVGLAGAGEGCARRKALLAQAGVVPVTVPDEGSLKGLQVLFVAGIDRPLAASFAARAHDLGILVNVEDIPELCDFHMPAIVRRGDLILTASTGGRAPGLARFLREWLDRAFGPEWMGHLDAVSAARAGWRAEGLAADEVSHRTRDMIAREGWLG